MHLFSCLGPNASISWWSLGGYCCLLVVSGWALVFPSGLLMDASITWWSLHGHWYVFLLGLWMHADVVVGAPVILFFSLLLPMRPMVLNFAPYGPCWYTRNFFFSLMLAMRPMVLHFAPYGPYWYTRIFFFSLMLAMSWKTHGATPRGYTQKLANATVTKKSNMPSKSEPLIHVSLYKGSCWVGTLGTGRHKASLAPPAP